ncbi:class I SAM-dependent methyltransferase [Leptospira sp. 201903070]|uniref:Class I SAM-dependent methyltransferase n=1 Tax=Leptospira ainlahdjerensis TaxID=2810033 RepID=A0ABS2U9Z1_9LEPT|nr:class I SAM-dependent methyltransferase [Leptospira ainlahdjerensis]MBM9575750.1 class I SAM-dependent methyltransferase [Leptospira ainlahdjerensis]
MLKKKPYFGFSNVYDAVMKDVQYDLWAEFILNSYSHHTENYLPNQVLDLGCGTCKLWEKFPSSVRFTGVDSSSEMLEIARKKAIAGEFVLSDLLDFKLENKTFDLILSTHDTLNYLKNDFELKKAFLHVRRHLAPDGLFFFDLSSLYNFKTHFDGQTFHERVGDFKIQWKNRYLEKSNRLESTLTFFHTRSKEEFSEVHEHTYFSRNTIHLLLKQCGLELLAEGSDYKDWILEDDASLVNYICRSKEINLRNL